MSEENTGTSTRNFRQIRLIIAGIGVLIIIAALGIELLGAGLEGGIGPAQQLMIGVGILVIFLAGLTPYLGDIYRTSAFLLLNTLLFLFLIEAGLFGWNSLQRWLDVKQPAPEVSGDETLLDENYDWSFPARFEYYQAQEWGDTHWNEITLLGARTRDYEPFVIWRNQPYEGETVNIDERGLRVTTDIECEDEDAYQVFVFGGSTIWGIGSPDEFTIPSYLQRELSDLRDEPVCVTNYGESGFVQTQQLIELIEQLQRGNVPDRVIFYDGANDIFAAYQNNNPYVHHNVYEIAQRLEGVPQDEDPNEDDGFSFEDSRFLMWMLNDTNIGQWLMAQIPPPERDASGIVIDNPEGAAIPVDIDYLSEKVVEVYMTNYTILETLAAQYDFAFDVYWQPVIYVGEKPITEEEAAFTTGYNVVLHELHQVTYALIEDLVADYDRLHYLGGVFDDTTDGVYTDFVHLNPIGNEVITQAILVDMQDD
ncbi:MAG: SGNH/GDSL hydrolase family protein [Aggregatilineales bacterium]